MTSLLYEAGLKEAATGLMPGIHRLMVPLWAEADHIDFDRFGAHSAAGVSDVTFVQLVFDQASGLFDALSGNFDDGGAASSGLFTGANKPVLGIHSQFSSTGTKATFVGDRNNLYRFLTSSSTSVGSGYTGVDSEFPGQRVSHWSMFAWGDWTVASNGKDKPQIFKTTAFADLAGVDFTRAEVMFRFGPHAVAVNTSNGENLVQWSAEDDIETWLPATKPTAGRLPVRDISGPFIAAAPLGDAWALYTESDMHIMQYGVSQNFRFGVLPGASGVGAVGKESIVSVGSVNYGLSKQGIFVTDGVSVKYLTDPSFGTWLERKVNWDYKSHIVGYFNKARKQLRWSVPLVNSQTNNHVVALNVASGAFGSNLLPFTFALEAEVSEFPSLGFSGGLVKFGEKGYANIAGLPITRRLRSKPLDFGRRLTWKDIHEVQAEIEKIVGTTVNLRIGVQEKLSDPISWGSQVALQDDLGSFVPANGTSGVFFSFEFSSTELNSDWVLSGFKVFGTVDDAFLEEVTDGPK